MVFALDEKEGLEKAKDDHHNQLGGDDSSCGGSSISGSVGVPIDGSGPGSSGLGVTVLSGMPGGGEIISGGLLGTTVPTSSGWPGGGSLVGTLPVDKGVSVDTVPTGVKSSA